MSPPFPSRTELRRELRGRRRALSLFTQRIAARQLAQKLRALPALKSARHVALYWPNDGEIDPRQLCHLTRRQKFYLPVLHACPADTLRFVRWRPGMRLTRNRFGIPEPHPAHSRPARAMDVILLPLVGFDAQGNRLGMGGGFYDRTLAFLHRVPRPRPLLVGVAHACQQVDTVAAARWDVPLAMIVTDKKVIRPGNS